ncbi:tRNA uridine-5-carboxymethylaminomethyl(34) synthesis GTPase MnmE [Rubricoccus marinus]|uniref:tRNA modification GTPase MnmE n=1 Tax=Rubricoccus marinus TaxID=716817 RepID=A0A259U1Y2_9BACT|nr:tRNA uridine-5-carboxymethylaminomethyl(34) synthesis GTPase MnmE [Rubricoccus marinus]OZC04009.1 tRNA uridine-5-carboxymethylaminomethyl(34) synthesis GTPase MnmE [Rubricoccus marinus]
MHHPDTIAALATARGESALAVVRVSGPLALEVASSRFTNAKLADAPSHTAHVGWVTNARGERVDQAVATVFRGPTSATGEDVVELTTHGGTAAPQAVLRALLDAGVRLAEPGEFTQRAFLAGKLDLAQAEAIADLIHARSTAAARSAARGIEGRTSGALATIKDRLVETAALVELELDFSDEDVEFADRETLVRLLGEASGEIAALLSTARLGAFVRDGVRVVLGGRPNAGKSTLLNALVERDRAIVSEVAGTTRDSVEAEREIDGLLFRFVDTAGLRETEDAIEAEGVRRSREAAGGADVLVYVADARTGLDAQEAAFLADLTARRPDLPIVHVANKADLLASGGAPNGQAGSASPQNVGAPEALALSAHRALTDPAALDGLRQRLLSIVRAGESEAESSVIVTNERHRQLLAQAHEAVGRAQSQLEAGASGDLLALDLRAALDALGRITGAVTADDVLGAVFGRFCIGK